VVQIRKTQRRRGAEHAEEPRGTVAFQDDVTAMVPSLRRKALRRSTQNGEADGSTVAEGVRQRSAMMSSGVTRYFLRALRDN
jgi:hypothetical protein